MKIGGQSIGIDENNTFQLIFFSSLIYSSIKTVGATVLGGFWALELNQTCAAQESACLIPVL